MLYAHYFYVKCSMFVNLIAKLCYCVDLKYPLFRTPLFRSCLFTKHKKTEKTSKMPAYNSQIKSSGYKMIGNVPLLPLKCTTKNAGRGVAPLPRSNDEQDIVDESLDLFKVIE